MTADWENLYGPLLIDLRDEYLGSRERIAVIGQEIKGWYYTYPKFVQDLSVDEAMRSYREFDFGAHHTRSPFWQFFRQIAEAAHPGLLDSRRSVLWANLIKFDDDEKSVLWKPDTEAVLSLQDGMFKEEIRIARPDVYIFLTGPYYDFILRRYYPELDFQAVPSQNAPLDKLQFARLVHPELPAHSYRACPT